MSNGSQEQCSRAEAAIADERRFDDQASVFHHTVRILIFFRVMRLAIALMKTATKYLTKEDKFYTAFTNLRQIHYRLLNLTDYIKQYIGYMTYQKLVICCIET